MAVNHDSRSTGAIRATRAGFVAVVVIATLGLAGGGLALSNRSQDRSTSVVPPTNADDPGGLEGASTTVEVNDDFRPIDRTLRAAWVATLDAQLQTRYPDTFGGVYVDGDRIIVNSTDASPLIDMIAELGASPVIPNGDQCELPVVVRTATMTYRDHQETFQRLLDDEVFGRDTHRFRMSRPDYKQQTYIVSIAELTSQEIDEAKPRLGDSVVLVLTYMSEITPLPGAVVVPASPSTP